MTHNGSLVRFVRCKKLSYHLSLRLLYLLYHFLHYIFHMDKHSRFSHVLNRYMLRLLFIHNHASHEIVYASPKEISNYVNCLMQMALPLQTEHTPLKNT